MTIPLAIDQHAQLERAAELRRAAMRYIRAWDDYFGALLNAEPPTSDRWRLLTDSAEAIASKVQRLREGEAYVRREAFREEMAERAREGQRKRAERKAGRR